MEPDNVITCCYCKITPEARNISQSGDPHVHCPCDKCKGRATWRMTAWRHMNTERDEPAQAALAKKARTSSTSQEGSDALPSETCEGNADLFNYCEFEDTYVEFPLREVCVEAGNDRSSDDDSDREGENNVEDQGEGELGDGIDGGDENGAQPPENLEEAEVLKKFVEDSVFRLVEMKHKMGCSINHFEELLEWGRQLHTRENNEAIEFWPKNWNDVQSMFKEMGYCEPKQYWICLSKDHISHYGLMESRDEACPHCGCLGTIPYYYIPLAGKVKQWCASPDMCKKMTAHWSQRNHWLPNEMKTGWGWPVKHELWDGTRFAELAYFWDPHEEWTLPVRCTYPGCNTVISASQILHSPEVEGGHKRVKCPTCGVFFEHMPRKARGDPRNIAYCGHWDGWQPFSSSLRGCGAIEVSIATMSKTERCHTNEVYVVGFVPTYLLPHKRSLSLDPFLEPLIRDLEEGFINGIPVNYASPIAGIASGPAQIRHVLLCWKGDHPAQCEAGKFIKCGKKACRRCEKEGVWVPDSNHYYYPEFRREGRFPTDKRSVVNNLPILREIEEEERITVKQAKSKTSGYTGLSIFYRLYPLYGFCHDSDFVYDEMHGVYLTVVKRQIQLLLDSENEDLNWQEVNERLKSFPWTHEHKTGRLPTNITNRFGYWKAEDLKHFAFPAMETCVSRMLDNDPSAQGIVSCLARIVEFLSNHARSGWTEADAVTFHEMCLRYAVLVEETHGTRNCVVTLHNLLHFSEDICRFSSLDNYSCWTEERAVRRYIVTSNNHKNIEVTFAFSEARREFLKMRGADHVDPEPLQVQKADISKAWAKTLHYAQRLLEESRATVNHDQLLSGILVGGMKSCELSDEDRLSISLKTGVCLNDVPEIGWSSRSLWKPLHSFKGLLYRVGEHVMCADPDQGDIVLKLLNLFCVRMNARVFVFGKGKTFPYIDVILGLKQVCPSDVTVLFEACHLSRKVMLLEERGVNEDPGTFIVVDFMRRIFPVSHGTVVIPYYPEINDMVDIEGDEQVWKARVLSYNINHKTINARFFIEGAAGLWVPERSPVQVIHFNSILRISRGHWQNEYSSWVDEEE